MLRVSLTRPLSHRGFSSSSLTWNTSYPHKSNERPDSEAPNNEAASSSTQHEPSQNSTNSQPLSIAQYDLDIVRQRIRDWTNRTASSFRTQADVFTARSKTTFSQLGLHLNKITGYEAIEALKRDVVEQEARINATRNAARQAKLAYEEAVAQRSNSQREVNDLLQRKSSWTDSDVGLFTKIVRQDHLFEQEEARSKAAVSELENALEREFSQLMRSILARYHEEQVWSDKIRSASTYGSLAVLGLNMLVFILAIAVVEPWKRRRLARTFERKIEELSRENEVRLDASMTQIGAQLASQEMLILELSDISKSLLSVTPPTIKHATQELEIANEVVIKAEEVQTERTIDRLIPKRDNLILVAVGTSAFIGGLASRIWLGR